MANTLMSLLVSIGVDTAEFQKGISEAQKAVGAFSKNMQSIGKDMTKLGAGLTVGLTLPIVAFGASSVKSAQDAESALADLEAVLKSTGGAAGVTLDELTANASALQKITKFSDEAVMSAQGMLLTFTNIGKEVFPDATMAALDMAEKFKMDASQAAITLGKALNDPIAGVTALRRIGVQLTDEQEKQIKSFMEVGDIASAQAIIMQELAVEIGGVAEAAGATSSGQFAQFINQLDDLKEIVGMALIPVMTRFITAITPLIEKFSNASPEVQNFILILAGILAVAGPIITTIGGIVTAIGAIAPVIAAAGPVIAAIGAGLSALAVPILILIGVLGALFLIWKTNFMGIQQGFATFVEIVTHLWNALLALLRGDTETALAEAGMAVRAYFDEWKRRLTSVGEWIVNLGSKVQNFAISVGGAFAKIITTAKQLLAIMKFVMDGIAAAITKVVQKIKEMAAALLGIKPPSVLDPGSPTPFEMGLRGIADAMSMLTRTQLPSLQSGLTFNPAMAGIGRSVSVPASNGERNITINIENPKKETAEESIRRTLKSLSYTGLLPE